MTVRDLIATLQAMPPDLLVYVPVYHEEGRDRHEVTAAEVLILQHPHTGQQYVEL